MSEQISSDIQVMANVESEFTRLSEKIGSMESEIRIFEEYYKDTWGEKAKKKFFSEMSDMHDCMLKLAETVKVEKTIIETARKNYENAENISSKTVQTLQEETPFSTKNMFNN